MPEMNISEQIERFRPLTDYLTKKTGLKVRFKVLSTYGDVLEHFPSNNLDGAFFGSFAAAYAHMKLDVEPVARPVHLNGKSTYNGYIFVRKESGIRTIKDMKGKVMAFVDKTTSAGYIYPFAYLKKNGVDDINDFLDEYYFTESHETAVYAVLSHKADVGAAKDTVYERIMKAKPWLSQKLVIIAESSEFPSNGLCVRKSLDETIKKKLRRVLLTMHTDAQGKIVLEQFGAKKFIQSSIDDYDKVFDLAEIAGIDLRSYDAQ